MNTKETKARQNQKWIIIILLILFAMPFSLSWFLFNYTEFGRGEGTASHGDLIVPPRLLPDATLNYMAGSSDETARLYNKWNLVYLLEGDCNEACEQNLYRMRQVRLAMGRHAHRVQRVLIDYSGTPAVFSNKLLREYQGQLVLNANNVAALKGAALFELTAGDRPLPAHRIYIVDPRGFLMMSYGPDTDPNGIIEDLKRLMRYSSIG